MIRVKIKDVHGCTWAMDFNTDEEKKAWVEDLVIKQEKYGKPGEYELVEEQVKKPGIISRLLKGYLS